MEQGGNPQIFEKQEADPECLFEIIQEQDPMNPKEMCFFIKIVVTKEMRARMADIQKNKKQKVARNQQREKTPQVIAIKEKCETYRKMDPKVFEQERRKNGGQNEVTKALADYEHLQASREKFSFSLFQSFEMRGKSNNIKFFYSSGQKHLSIRINKSYFLNEMHLSRRDLFNVAVTFTRTWQFDFHGMIRVLWRIYTESEKPFYTLYIRSLDLISVTFDVIYHDKRTYRFRYSPFQFRTSPIFKEDNQLTGYYQTLSCLPQISSSKGSVLDQDFYVSPRFFIFDDLTDNNLFYKILNRTNLVYQIYTISKGTFNSNQGAPLQIDEFAKKSLGHFYFSSTRLKKMMFTWSFKQFVRNRDKKSKQDDKGADKKQVILHIPFQLDRNIQQNANQSTNGQPVYQMRMQIIEVNKQITYAVKQDLAYRIKQWYLLIKQMLLQRQKGYFQSQKQFLNQVRRDINRIDVEDFDMNVNFTSRDRFDKFFIGFLLLASTTLDRHYFTLTEDKDRKREDSKIVYLQTNESLYFSKKQGHIHYYHSAKLFFRHTYFPHMFWNSAKQDQKQTFYNYLQNARNADYRLKCGQWKLQRIIKTKKKLSLKNNQQNQMEEAQLSQFPDDFKRYIGILIRHFPLRIIYKDILAFVDAIMKTCYMPQEDKNEMKLNGLENILKSIINVLLQQYYYCQFKQKQQKLKQNEKEKQKEDRQNNQVNIKDPRQEIKIEFDPVKRQKDKEKIQDLFSRVLIVKIITRGDVGFTPEQKLHFQVTFKLMEFKSVWLTRIKEGTVILRIFEERLEIEKDYVTVHAMKGDIRTNKKLFDEASIRANLQACFVDPKNPNAL